MSPFCWDPKGQQRRSRACKLARFLIVTVSCTWPFGRHVTICDRTSKQLGIGTHNCREQHVVPSVADQSDIEACLHARLGAVQGKSEVWLVWPGWSGGERWIVCGVIEVTPLTGSITMLLADWFE